MSPKSDKGETPETSTEVVEEAVVPEPEREEEVFDKERAMKTITQLREVEKKAKVDAKRLADYEKNEQARIDAEKSELQKANERAVKAEAEAKAIRLDLLRREVADRIKLPMVFANRIKGENPEDMEADAKELLAAIPKPVPPALGPTNPPAPITGETDAERRKRLGI